MTTTTLLPSNYSQNGTKSSFDRNGAANTADYDTFIKLLIAQMRYQDPTEPVDATQYVSQLASFSAVEQTLQINQKIDEMLVNGPIAQASNYIGKYVTSDDGKIAGTVKSVKIYSDGVVATLDSGEELIIGPGVTVSDKPPEEQPKEPPKEETV